MHNKKVLIDALRKLGNAKAPTAKKDIIVDPNGQWAHPGEITRIPSNTITMQGVPYPVMAKPNVGQPQMMYPGQDYHFPDADYVDEFPTNNKSLVKKSMGGLTRFSGSAGKMMGLPPIMSTLGNTAPKVVAKFPIMNQDTKNLLTNPAIDSYFPIRFGGDPYLPAGLEAYYIDPEDYNILNEATQQLETDPNWRQEGLKNAYSSLYGSGKLDGYRYDPNLFKGIDYTFKDFSPGWQVAQNALHQLAGPQWMPSKEDFFTDEEIINLFQKEIDYRNARNQFDKMYPEDPATTMWNAFNQDTSRDELFSNLFPGVYMPNFRSKILSPEQTEALINKGLYNPTFTNKKMLNKSSLSSLTKGEDTLPRTYKEYIDTYDINSPLYTGDPKLIASEFRGQLGLKLDDINNATPEQLEAWRKQVIIKLRNSALERWQKETSNKLSGSDAYNQLMNRSGARNKDGGVVKKEGGESPKEFVSAKEGVDTPIYKQVSVKPSKIQGKGLFTNEPIRAGEPIGISHIRKVFNRNGELYQAPFPSTVLGYYNHSEEPNVREVDNGDHIVMVATRDIKPNEELTSNYNLSGIPDLEKPEDFKKGGSIPKLPKKKNARAYSRSLEATNRLLAEHPFFAQPKSRKNKIYDPNSQYFQDGGEPGDKFKKRLMKRYPGMQGVYGAEGENLSIVKDPNYDARSVGYGDIEFQFPEGNPEIKYDNLIEENGPEYIYPNPSPNTYLALYNPRGANRGDVFLDMMHGMRDDPNYLPLLQNFEKAVRDARGEDMTWEYEGQVKNGSTQSRDRFDENYIDGQLRAQLAPGSIGMFSKGRKDYRIERKYDSPEMRAAAKDIRNYLKGKPTEEDYIEADLTPEEIQEYAKGGYIIEDISVPELTKARNGKELKTFISAIDDISNVINGAGKASTVQKIVNRAITPVGYNFPAKLLAAPLTFAFPHKPETTSLQNRYDAWNVYNQMAPKYDSFIMNTDGTVSIKNFELPKTLLDEIVNSKRNSFETAEFNDRMLAGDPLNFGGVHGNGNIIKGIDEEGRPYIDFVDTWDLQPFKHKGYLPKNVQNFEFGQLIGSKPFDLRNRIYYDNDGNYFDQNGELLLENEIETPDIKYGALAQQIAKNASTGNIQDVNYTTSKKKILSTKDYNIDDDDQDWGIASQKSKLNTMLGIGIGLGGAAAYNYEKSKNKIIVTDPKTGKYIEVDKDEWSKKNKSLYNKNGGELSKASYGMITKASNALSKVSKVPSPSGWVRGTTSIIPRVPPTKLTLGSIPADFPANVTFPLDIYNKDQSGYLTLYPNPKVKGVDDNTFHFLAKMPNSMEAGRAFQLMNQAFTKPNPSILEPYSLSLDSYNMLLNMGKRPDWQMTYENHIPLNYMSVNHNLFEGLEVPRGIRTGRPLKQETADEMVKRLNDMLLQKGMTEQARVFNVPGGSLKEIQVPNYRLTRQYAKGGFLPKAANGLQVGLSELGKLGRAGLYKSINPAGYAILDKVKALPTELYKNTVSNETRPFRVGMSLKYGHQPHLETLLKTKRIPLEEFKKMSDKDRMQVFDQSTLSKLNDIGQRRLDAWAVGLGLPQEYGTLEQIGDNKFRMLNTTYSPDYFNDLYNDLRASGYEQGLSFGHNPLEDLTREHYRIKRQANYGNEQELDDWMRQQDAMRIAGWNPWVRSRHAKLNDLQPFSGVSTGKVWDNDQFGVMGGFGWDINDHPQGLQFTTNDIWDLNPWEKRGHAYLNPTDAAKQIAASSFFKPLQNVEALKLVGGKPFLIENNFVVDPKTYKTLDSWEEGGNVDYTLGDEVDEATMRELEKLGYTFEKI